MSTLESLLVCVFWLIGMMSGITIGAIYRELSALIGATVGFGVGIGCAVCSVLASMIMPDLSVLWVMAGAVGSVVGPIDIVKRTRVKSLDED